jgi:hypothetical protein
MLVHAQQTYCTFNMCMTWEIRYSKRNQTIIRKNYIQNLLAKHVNFLLLKHFYNINVLYSFILLLLFLLIKTIQLMIPVSDWILYTVTACSACVADPDDFCPDLIRLFKIYCNSNNRRLWNSCNEIHLFNNDNHILN